MKCYNHPNKEAVGVCVVCNQGVCEDCAVKVAGKVYCKADVEKAFAIQKPLRIIRSSSVEIATLFYGIFGAMTAIGGIALLWYSSSGQGVPIIPGITAFLAALRLDAIPGGYALVGAGILMVVAAYGVWVLNKAGAELSVAISVFAILVSVALAGTAAVGAGSLAMLFAFLFGIYVTHLSWNELR